MADAASFISMRGIGKSFGPVRALSGVDLTIRAAEVLGVVGHNGAGKSTLMGVLRGTVPRGEGALLVDDIAVAENWDVREARRLGIRSVFQEPSLCPSLTVVENTRLVHRSLRGLGWARRARNVIGDALEAIFPNHGIGLDRVVGELPTGERQMVEIARAFSVVSGQPRLVILDEPTSALDAQVASQFLSFIGRVRHQGVACLLISHRLKEIIDHTDRVVVMRDGRVVDERSTTGLSPDQLVDAMGVMAQAGEATPTAVVATRVGASTAPDMPQRITAPAEGPAAIPFIARAGQIIGLAGLDGHGQRDRLLAVFRAARKPESGLTVVGRVSYVSGDRHREGIFPLWSISHNLTIGLMRKLSRHGVMKPRDETAAALDWRGRLSIKTPDVRLPILSLSGGNQQKVLIARALASGSEIVLLDDPMRGVDVGSKREMFARIRDEAISGKCFLLYTTETEELTHCDRVYVFYQGAITDEIAHADLTEDRVLSASFGRSASMN